MSKSYFTHDNGGRPFKVTINADGTVNIYKNITDYDVNDPVDVYSTTPILTYSPESVFVGKSPINPMTKFSGGHGPKFDGNSVLLKISADEYIIIGNDIRSFNTSSPIIEYVSPVGNNDVPYPYAIDEQGHYYLLSSDVILLKVPKNKRNDVADYYYEAANMTQDMGICDSKPKTNPFAGIVEFRIGGERYTLNYEGEPAKEYDRLIEYFGSPIEVIKTDKKKYKLTKQEYVSLMEDYGKKMGFVNLPTKVIVRRLE